VNPSLNRSLVRTLPVPPPLLCYSIPQGIIGRRGGAAGLPPNQGSPGFPGSPGVSNPQSVLAS